MPGIVRGPAARAHKTVTTPAHPLRGSHRAGPRLADPTEPVKFRMADGRVALVVSPPKLQSKTGAMAPRMYWRIRPYGWTKLKETSSPTWTGAQAEAQRLLETLTAGAGEGPQILLRDAIATYVARHTGGGRPARGNRRRRTARTPIQWSTTYSKATRQRLDVLSAELGDVRCGHLNYQQLTAFLAGRPSYNAELEMVKTVSALLGWLTRNAYVLPSQALEGRLKYYELTHADTGGRLGQMDDAAGAAVTGQSEWSVTDDEVPDTEAVHAAAEAMPATTRNVRKNWFLQLMLLVAAYVGLRLGELIALTWEDIEAVDKPARAGQPRHELRIAVRRQHVECGGAHIEDLKGRRSRSCIVPLVTPGNYPLTAQLRLRAAEARAEQAAGTNPAGLLFPAPSGGTFWRSNLRQRYWYKALAVGGWATATPEQARRALLREQARAWVDAVDDRLVANRYVWTFHSLRHVAARYWVFDVRDVEGDPLPLVTASQHLGHASTAVTEQVYVGGQKR